MMKIATLIFVIALPVIACQSGPVAPPPAAPQSAEPEKQEVVSTDTLPPAQRPEKAPESAPDDAKSLDQVESGAYSSAGPGSPQSGFSDISALDPTIKLDIRYATTNNFTKSKIYDCPRCLLRPEAADAIVKANKALKAKGYALKMFDCYRPRPYQQRLWDKVPNPDYVTPPAKGSMHSRGAAVDLTIVDAQGRELEMGTPYDFFGVEAHTDYTKLPARVLENRALLRTTLEAVGFKGIRTEWWHFSYQKRNYALSDYLWPCN
jgi:D-alanyl-D-alanine dipeptidase